MSDISLSRFSRATTAAVALTLATVSGCAQSRPARAQDAAHDFNNNLRFGRSEIAIETVDEKYRTSFTERHKAWGEDIVIADSELAGIKVEKDEATISVKISWYRADQGDLQTSTIKQTWTDDKKGAWRLSDERVEGRQGLFGERPAATDETANPAQKARAKQTQFPTVVLGQQQEAPPTYETTDDNAADPAIKLTLPPKK